RRWVRDFNAVADREGANPPLPLRPDGTYLVTGGFGGIGLELATFLAERTRAARIVLAGRRTLPPREQWPAILAGTNALHPDLARVVRRIVQMEAHGSTIVTLSVDLASPDLEPAIIACMRETGPFDGVVHAAGSPDSGLIHTMSRDRLGLAFAGKVHGLLNLLTILDLRDLDFFVNCWSLASLVGGVGLADYAAANAWLDALALRQTARGARMITINWDAWHDIGMARFVPTGDGADGAPAVARLSLKDAL